MIQRLKSRGFLPATIVSLVLAVAFAVPTFGGMRAFISTAYVCTGVTITAVPTTVVAHPQSGGTHVIATATASGCTTTPRYEFWLRTTSNPIWQMTQAYGTSNTFDWNSTGAVANDTVYLGVHAKDASSSNAYDSVASTPVTITPPPTAMCTGVTITANPTSVNNDPFQGGTHVIATAVATGCTNPNPLYEFWLRVASNPNWTMTQAYSTTATFDWNSSGALPNDTVYLGVHAKDAQSSSAVGYDKVASTPVLINQSQCTGVTIAAVPTTVVHTNSGGTHVIATATGTGCTNSARYEFWLRTTSNPVWQMTQAYGTSNTFDWNSTGALPNDTVYLGVHVKDVNSVSATGYDKVASTPVTVT